MNPDMTLLWTPLTALVLAAGTAPGPAGLPDAAMAPKNAAPQDAAPQDAARWPAAVAGPAQGATPPLSPRTAPEARRTVPAGRRTGVSSTTVLGSLVIVLGLVAISAWVFRRGVPAAGWLPGEVAEVLGRVAWPGKHPLHVVRFGNKLLLVCVVDGQAQTLSTIDDPAEVARLTAACDEMRQEGELSFRALLDRFSRGGRLPETAGGAWPTAGKESPYA